jgi:tetraacyldisaccharide 4'-kinase
VICIGNLVAGGSGKTPTALALMALIREQGLAQNPCFLTRGYGGRLEGPVFVSSQSYEEVGDESLLLARVAPVIVAKERTKGAALAARSGHDLIVMDDGFQNPALHKDASFVVVDGRTGFGNGYLIPFGPLRECVSDGLARANAIIKIGGETSLHTAKTVMNAHIEAQSDLPPGTKVFAFCGLGQPEKFRQSLLEQGYEIAGFKSFADHHPYTVAEVKNLHAEAFQHKAHLITTEKDVCRLPSAENIHVLRIRLVFDHPEEIISQLQGIKR